MTKKPIILDLCGGTGSWSRPYTESGKYDVRVITLPGYGDFDPDYDVRVYDPPAGVHGILAAPPCTEFAVSGARWWASKAPHILTEAIEVVTACQRVIAAAQPAWWALENPVGRLPNWIGPYNYTFQPYEYGDPWLKRTCIWGTALAPVRTPVQVAPVSSKNFKSKGGKYKNRATALNVAANSRHNNPGEVFSEFVRQGILPPDWIHRLGPSPDRATLRSITPPGFARAFFLANP